MNSATTVGTIDWTHRTGGRLEPAQRRRLVADVARVHIGNAVGRFRLIVHLHPGRSAYVAAARLSPPDSVLTRAARDAATRVLPEVLLNHSFRTYTFGRALGELDKVDVDTELLFAAALLHDTGLVLARGRDDFTLTSARVARDVAEQVGLSTAATETLQTAITRHHSPRVTRDAGPVAYLLPRAPASTPLAYAAGTSPAPPRLTPSASTHDPASRSTSPTRGRTRPRECRKAGPCCCVGMARSQPQSPSRPSRTELDALPGATNHGTSSNARSQTATASSPCWSRSGAGTTPRERHRPSLTWHRPGPAWSSRLGGTSPVTAGTCTHGR